MKLTKSEARSLILANQLKKRNAFEICSDFCGIQAQFAAYPEQAIKIRSDSKSFNSTWKDALIRGWGIRNTMHVFPKEDLGLYLNDKRLNHFFSGFLQRENDIISPDKKTHYCEIILDELGKKSLTRDELKSALRKKGLTAKEEKMLFNSWGGAIAYLYGRGKIALSFGTKGKYSLAPSFAPVKYEEACLELTRRYIANYGPVSLNDFRYFFKDTVVEIKRRIKALNPDIMDVEGETRYYFKDSLQSLKPYKNNSPVFLAGFDPLLLGYEKRESLFLDPKDIRAVFTMTGIIKPTIIYKSRIIGTWRMEKGEKEITYFES